MANCGAGSRLRGSICIPGFRGHAQIFCATRYDFPVRTSLSILIGALFLLPLAGCGKAPAKTDAELGLNAQQADGQRVFQMYCASCHHAYSRAGSQGPSLAGLYRKQYLPSGLPANDRFVGQAIMGGRGMMPPIGTELNQQQFEDLMAYLHTL
jgi:mono/diheme cytochrome c family protein